MLTAKLNNGVTVLAKNTKYGVSALTFANRTQATRAAERHVNAGAYVSRFTGRPFYVVIPTPHNLTSDELKAAL